MDKLVVFLFLSLIGSIVAFETCSNERCEHSCKNRCGDKPNKQRYTCQCNAVCEKHKDCCDDYPTCKYIDPNFDEADHHFDITDTSCKGRCGQKYKKKDSCHCNKKCVKFNNCCADHDEQCGGGGGVSGTGSKQSGAASYHSGDHKDSDPKTNEADHFEITDTSCKGRCGQKYKKKDSCHCNKKCGKHNNCCADHDEQCGGGGGVSGTGSKQSGAPGYHSGGHKDVDISNEELKVVSEKLYQSDVNKAVESDIKLNKQELVDKNGIKEDLSDSPLYHFVNEELFKKPTYKAFINLLDNYDRKTGTDEEFSPEELKEQEHYLQEVMKTKVMKELFSFFQQKGLYQTEEEFTSDLQNMWFGLYSRSKGEKDSSGFEHVFVGEVKKGQVSGFHSWIRFYHLEKNGMLNYFSHNYDGPWENYPDVLGKQFHWDGYLKEVGSQFIGSSPEFDLAMYTLCYVSRPGKKCTLSMGGHKICIQTYEWTKNTYGKNKKYIATAYPVV